MFIDADWIQTAIFFFSPGFILAIALLVYRDRPKIKQDDVKHVYINDETAEKIEQRELSISWGKIPFFRKLKLIEIQKTAIYEITYIPINNGNLENPLPYDCSKEKTSKVGKEIFLINRSFFGTEKIRHVCFLSKSPLKTNYREKIKIKKYPRQIMVINENPIEVRNYAFQIPKDVTLIRFSNNTMISDLSLEIPFPYLTKIVKKSVGKCQGEGFIVKATLSELIPPKKGEIPGKLEIRLT